MAYTKIEWLDHGETNAKPIDKDNLNHMDEGIYNLQNIELIAVTDIEPTTFEDGNKYYNTKENLVYTAENQIWTNGETPRSGVFYLVLTDSKNYYYDGTTLISVGGGASNDVIISPEEPTTEDWKIWIDTDEIGNLGSEVVDTLEGNQTDKAPSVRAVKEANKYSTEETFTGKYWIDGKPIYRKVINVDSLPNAVRMDVPLNTNYDKIITVRGMAYANNTTFGTDTFLPIPIPNETDISSSMKCFVQDGNLRIDVGSDRSAYSGYFILEYTKTTD